MFNVKMHGKDHVTENSTGVCKPSYEVPVLFPCYHNYVIICDQSFIFYSLLVYTMAD